MMIVSVLNFPDVRHDMNRACGGSDVIHCFFRDCLPWLQSGDCHVMLKSREAETFLFPKTDVRAIAWNPWVQIIIKIWNILRSIDKQNICIMCFCSFLCPVLQIPNSV